MILRKQNAQQISTNKRKKPVRSDLLIQLVMFEKVCKEKLFFDLMLKLLENDFKLIRNQAQANQSQIKSI